MCFCFNKLYFYCIVWNVHIKSQVSHFCLCSYLLTMRYYYIYYLHFFLRTLWISDIISGDAILLYSLSSLFSLRIKCKMIHSKTSCLMINIFFSNVKSSLKKKKSSHYFFRLAVYYQTVVFTFKLFPCIVWKRNGSYFYHSAA